MQEFSQPLEIVREALRRLAQRRIQAERSRDDLRLMRDRAQAAEKEIDRLHTELTQTSEMVRHDQLTGVLNRKALDEAFERELARARRRDAPLSVALLDIDNFKALNDAHGHQAGDDALVHLVGVIRETLRPHDTVARYGGEEFIVLLPETGLEDAAAVMRRLQRELTKRFFLHENDRVLITFSAGSPASARTKSAARRSPAPTPRCIRPSAPARTGSWRPPRLVR